MMHVKRLKRGGLALAVLSLAACGGSGDEDSALGPVLMDAEALSAGFVSSFAAFETAAARLRETNARYLRQDTPSWYFASQPTTTYSSYPLASAHVEYAHAAGLSGKGQTIAIVDDGFNRSHEAFAGKPITVSGSIRTENHGTGVASVAAGRSATFIGVAPDAALVFGLYDNAGTLAAATNRAIQMGAVVQNNSWGFFGTPATLSSYRDTFRGTDGQNYLAALRSFTRTGIVVFAISNETTSANGLMDALPLFEPGLESGWLAVGNAVPALDASGDVVGATRVSSACGQSARWCLVADGAWESAAAFDNSGAASNSAYRFATGSSFAAPQVSGAIALLAEAFPQLTPAQLRLRLLASANNTFFAHDGVLEVAPEFSHGYSSEFGHGFLDVRAALLPIGTPQIATVDGGAVTADAPLLVTGAALGDAVQRSLDGIDVAMSDALGGEFAAPAGGFVAAAAPQPLAAAMVARTQRRDLTSDREAAPAPVLSGLSALPGQTVTLAAPGGAATAEVLMPTGPTSGYGVALKSAFGDGATRAEIGLKVARDGGTLIGIGNGEDDTDMVALELGLSQDLGGGAFLALGGEIGVADLGGSSGPASAGSARFDAVSLDIGARGVFASGDRLTLGVAMPTAVTSGSGTINLPVALAAGGVEFQSVDLDLAPADRQVNVSVSYQVPVGEKQEVLFEVLHAENFGNRAGMSATAGQITYRITF